MIDDYLKVFQRDDLQSSHMSIKDMGVNLDEVRKLISPEENY